MNNNTTNIPGPSVGVETYENECRQRIAAQLPELRQRLRGLGGVVATAEYDGSGDSGQIEDVILQDAANQCMTMSEADSDALNALFYDLLETRFGGWENDAGAFGTFTWTLETDALEHNHHERYENYSTENVSGWSDVEGNAPKAGR